MKAGGNDKEQYLEQVTLGKREPHNGEITLSEYDPQWPMPKVA